jgi:hypothetical protein
MAGGGGAARRRLFSPHAARPSHSCHAPSSSAAVAAATVRAARACVCVCCVAKGGKEVRERAAAKFRRRGGAPASRETRCAPLGASTYTHRSAGLRSRGWCDGPAARRAAGVRGRPGFLSFVVPNSGSAAGARREWRSSGEEQRFPTSHGANESARLSLATSHHCPATSASDADRAPGHVHTHTTDLARTCRALPASFSKGLLLRPCAAGRHR